MNVIMYMPGVLLIMALTKGIWKALLSFIMIIIMQFVWGLEFILYMSPEYFQRAYNFSRVFHMGVSQIYKWLLHKNNAPFHSVVFIDSLILLSLMSLLFILLSRWLPVVNLNSQFSIRKSMKMISLWPINI